MPIPNNIILGNNPHLSVLEGYGFNVTAGTGDDTIAASIGNVTVTGTTGTIHFIGAAEYSSRVVEANGRLVATSGTAGGYFQGGTAGGNVLVSQGDVGTTTQLVAVAAGDVLYGSKNGGTDSLLLGAGRETVVAGTGPTTVAGGSGQAAIFMGAGSGTVLGGTGSGDSVIGGAGTLSVTAQNGDAVFAGSGTTVVNGSLTGADSLVGGAGGLHVSGRGGNMLVVSGSGSNQIATGNGAALVFAQAGNTTLAGGAGSLQVELGRGQALVTEGAGSTTYDLVNGSAGGSATVAGFTAGKDHIDLFGYSQAQEHITSTGGNTVLAFDDGSKITLLGVAHYTGA